MMTYTTRFLLLFMILGDSFKGLTEAEASLPTLELRDHEFEQISAYTVKVYDDIKTTLDDTDIRKKNALPPLGTSMMPEESETYDALQRGLMLQKCLIQFPHYSEGTIIAALLRIYEFEDPSENVFAPQHLKPDITPEQLEDAETFLKTNSAAYKDAIFQSETYQNYKKKTQKGLFGTLTSLFTDDNTTPHQKEVQKSLAEELLAAELVQGLADHLSLSEAMARNVFVYLQARDHWHPHEYKDTGSLAETTPAGPPTLTPDTNTIAKSEVDMMDKAQAERRRTGFIKLVTFSGFALFGGMALSLGSQP